MKKVISLLSVAMFMCVCSLGQASQLSALSDEQQVIELDAPRLVKLGNDLYAGVSVSKDLHNTSSDEGVVFLAKVTWLGSLADLSNLNPFTKGPVE